jgi:hypothetical protein
MSYNCSKIHARTRNTYKAEAEKGLMEVTAFWDTLQEPLRIVQPNTRLFSINRLFGSTGAVEPSEIKADYS